MVVGWNDKSGATKVAASQLLSTESRTPSPSFGRILKRKKTQLFQPEIFFWSKDFKNRFYKWWGLFIIMKVCLVEGHRFVFLKQIESKAEMHFTTNWNVTVCFFVGNLIKNLILKCESLRENCDPRRSNFHIFVYLPRLFFILTFIANISSVVMLSASFRSTLN